MPFEKGHKLATGRPKGSPNKIRYGLADKLKELSFDTTGELIKLFYSTENDMIKAKILMHFHEYMFPKLSSISVVMHDDDLEGKSLEELIEIAKERKLLDAIATRAIT
jgi:hypothetical protein